MAKEVGDTPHVTAHHGAVGPVSLPGGEQKQDAKEVFALLKLPGRCALPAPVWRHLEDAALPCPLLPECAERYELPAPAAEVSS